MFLRMIAAALLAAHAGFATAQGFADEERDWGVPPQPGLRPAPYTAPTPLALPGARVVRAEDLKRFLSDSPKPVLIDVASGEGHVTLADALWWPGMGRGANFIDAVQGEFAQRLEQATGGDRARPVAFFCVNSQCWLSYNAGLRAVALGYSRVLWFRGGVEAWREAGLPLARVRDPWTAALPPEAGSDKTGPR